MRRPDDLPVDLPDEWRQVVCRLARLRSMEADPKAINLRREELRKQAARIQAAAEQERENTMAETENHVTLLITRALHLAKAEEFVEALDFLQKATDQITQLNARRQQTRMVGGGRPYRKAVDDEAVAV